jgi:hypothetical protein
VYESRVRSHSITCHWFKVLHSFPYSHDAKAVQHSAVSPKKLSNEILVWAVIQKIRFGTGARAESGVSVRLPLFELLVRSVQRVCGSPLCYFAVSAASAVMAACEAGLRRQGSAIVSISSCRLLIVFDSQRPGFCGGLSDFDIAGRAQNKFASETSGELGAPAAPRPELAGARA